MTFIESEHPRTRTGTFTTKAHSAPELALHAEPAPAEEVQLSPEDFEMFDAAPHDSRTIANGETWRRLHNGTWRHTTKGEIRTSRLMWAHLTMNTGAGTNKMNAQLLPPPVGENVLGDGVVTDTAQRDANYQEPREVYRYTPVTREQEIGRGEYKHIGEGVWMKRCRECDAYVKSYGPLGYVREFAVHEKSHGLSVPGHFELRRTW